MECRALSCGRTLASRQLRRTLYPAETKLNHGTPCLSENSTSGTKLHANWYVTINLWTTLACEIFISKWRYSLVGLGSKKSSLAT